MLFATSCSSDDLEKVQSGNEAQVKFSLNLEGGVASRAISDGKKADNLFYAIYNAEKKLITTINSSNQGLLFKDAAFSTSDLKENVTVTLAKGQEYTAVFWADNEGCDKYTVTAGVDKFNVQVNYGGGNNNEYRDAFYAAKTFEVSGDATIDVELKRPFAQINVGVIKADWDAAVKSGIEIENSSVVIKNVANVIDILTGEVTGNETVTYTAGTITSLANDLEVDVDKDGTIQNDEKYKWLSMSYILPSATPGNASTTLESLEYTFEPKNGEDIILKNGLNNVPVQRNWRTNIIGKLLTGDITFDITIDPAYIPNGDNNIEIGEQNVSGVTELETAMANNNSTESIIYNIEGLSASNNVSVSIPSNFVSENVTFNFTDIKNGANLTITGADYAKKAVIKVPTATTITQLTVNTPYAHVVVAQGIYTDIDATTSSSTLVVAGGVQVQNTITVQAGNVQIQKDAEVNQATIIQGNNNDAPVFVYVDKGAQAPTTGEDVIISNETANEAGVYTITLTKDINLSEILVLDKGTILDGNEHTLTSTAGRAINVATDNKVVIKNLTIVAEGERAINVIQKPANLTIENVIATADNYTLNVATSAGAAQVAINNSTLTGACTVNVSGAGADVSIEGSTINCVDENTTAGEAYAALSLNYEAEGGSIIATNTTVNVTECSDSMKGRNAAEEGTVTINGSTNDVVTTVAVITYEGSPYYHGFQTLADAVEFAKGGETITVIRDITLTETCVINKAISLDLNDKKITANTDDKDAFNISGNATITNGSINTNSKYAIVIDNEEGLTDVNFTDLNITGTRSENNGAIILVGYAKVTLGTGVNINASGYICVVESSTNEVGSDKVANVIIDGASLTLVSASDIGSVIGAGHESTITVISGTIDGTKSPYAACAFPTGGTVNINDGTINGTLYEHTPYKGKKTEIIVSGGTFNNVVTSEFLKTGYTCSSSGTSWTVSQTDNNN